jgi:hypothetical protein
MNIDINLIGNCLIAVFLYNLIIETTVAVIIKHIFKKIMRGGISKENKETFKDKLKKKLDE